MGVPAEQIKGALRLSWCHERARLHNCRGRAHHLTPEVPWDDVADRMRGLR
jgi:hypothetical protein